MKEEPWEHEEGPAADSSAERGGAQAEAARTRLCSGQVEAGRFLRYARPCEQIGTHGS